MARSVKDLRELICVSRLTYQESDEEVLSDSDSTVVENDLKRLNLGNGNYSGGVDFSGRQSVRESSMCSTAESGRVSPDSGFITNSSPPSTGESQHNSESSVELKSPHPPSNSSPTKRRRKKKKEVNLPPKHDLPKATALPPVMNKSEFPRNSIPEHTDQKELPKSYCYDALLTYIDASIVAGWLQRANENVTEMSRFCNFEDSFVQFAHFWLTSFPDVQKTAIYEMEYDILIDELNLAFAVGRQSGKVSRRDILALLSAIFKEYPESLLSAKGGHLFLNYLDVLSSNRTSEYKQLLSEVKCSTKNKQYAQWLLAARSFALVNVWSAILNFYRNLLGKTPVAGCLPLPSSMHSKGVHQQRMYHAIRLDYVDVIHYLIKSGHVKSSDTDSHGRTWIFTAVMHNCPETLSYLLTRVQSEIDVNQASDTGNTALHAAANQGNVKLTEILLKAPGINVNCRNAQCEQATPLHLAVMHGDSAVVKAFLSSDVDVSLKMGDMTPLDIANDFGHRDIAAILQKLSTAS